MLRPFLFLFSSLPAVFVAAGHSTGTLDRNNHHSRFESSPPVVETEVPFLSFSGPGDDAAVAAATARYHAERISFKKKGQV